MNFIIHIAMHSSSGFHLYGDFCSWHSEYHLWTIFSCGCLQHVVSSLWLIWQAIAFLFDHSELNCYLQSHSEISQLQDINNMQLSSNPRVMTAPHIQILLMVELISAGIDFWVIFELKCHHLQQPKMLKFSSNLISYRNVIAKRVLAIKKCLQVDLIAYLRFIKGIGGSQDAFLCSHSYFCHQPTGWRFHYVFERFSFILWFRKYELNTCACYTSTTI